MIKIKVEKENNKVKEVLIKGHALYDTLGKDIVCAAVSSIVITTVNACLSIDKDSVLVDENEFKISIIKESDTIEKLIINMIDLLKELEKEYPKNIKFL